METSKCYVGSGSARLACLFIVLLTATGLWLPRTGQASIADLPYRVEPAITSSIGLEQSNLSADGSLIVWQDRRSGVPDVYAYDLNDGREFRVAREAGFRTQPVVSDNRIVWLAGADPSQRTIAGIDLSQGRTFVALEEAAEISDPALSGNTLIWRQRSEVGWNILAKDLQSNRTTALTNQPINHANPSISGTNVVWQEYRDDNWDIVWHDLSTGSTTRLTTTAGDETAPVVAGDKVAFCRQAANGGAPELVVRELASGNEKVVSRDHIVMQPSFSGSIVVWEDWRTGLPDVYAYDVGHDEAFAVARSQQAYDPVASESAIAWVSRSDLASGRIQAVALVQRLPTDPREPPAVPSADHVYVPETRHFMSAGFKGYWQANGGPDLFGHPLTEEFTEKDPVTGKQLTVQYFERVKLQFDPSAPEGDRISLARLGAELTSDRQIERIAPFENSPERIYFEETGHSLAYGFKEFWENNGGLALFGFPISEELVENGRTVQYFERARFEFNPDATDDRYRVILGLLGREALQRKGWLPTPPIDTTLIYE